MEPKTPQLIPNRRTSNPFVLLLRSILQYLRRSSSIPPPFSFNPPPFSAVPRYQFDSSLCESKKPLCELFSWSQGTNAFSSGGDQALRIEDGYSDHENIGRLNVLDLQVAEYAFVGGHVLHMMVTYVLSCCVWFCSKKACKKWFLTRFYTADKAEKTGLINTVVRHLHFVASNLVLKHSSSIEAAEESSDGRRSESS
ncbi:1,4-dihydroxy-2-naphthoyl-CoA synthase [Trifolium repens]|nr:1,4-dihydroxy-2-naphthoyl-CoA synthase [Trifolium repens]